MKKMKLTAALLTVAALAFSITGCGSKFDAKAYVQGNLDANFKNDISDEFAKLTEGGRESIEAEYAKAIDDLTSTYRSAGCPEDMIADYKTTTQDILKACKYTVGDAVKDNDGNYTVPVTVEPIQLKSEEMNAEAEEFLMDWATENMENLDEQALMNEYFAFLLGKLQDVAANPTYGEATTVDVHVNKVSNNLYDIPMADQTALTTAMLSD